MAKEKKKERPNIQKMLVALIGGIVLGLIFGSSEHAGGRK